MNIKIDFILVSIPISVGISVIDVDTIFGVDKLGVINNAWSEVNADKMPISVGRTAMLTYERPRHES